MFPGPTAFSISKTRRIAIWQIPGPSDPFTDRSGLDNPMLEVFKIDPEFKSILADMNQKFEIARRSIREHEAASAQD